MRSRSIYHLRASSEILGVAGPQVEVVLHNLSMRKWGYSDYGDAAGVDDKIDNNVDGDD